MYNCTLYIKNVRTFVDRDFSIVSGFMALGHIQTELQRVVRTRMYGGVVYFLRFKGKIISSIVYVCVMLSLLYSINIYRRWSTVDPPTNIYTLVIYSEIVYTCIGML